MRLSLLTAAALASALGAAVPAVADSIAVGTDGNQTVITSNGKPCRVVTGDGKGGSTSTTVTTGNGLSGSTSAGSAGSSVTISPGGSGSSVSVGSGSSGSSAAAGSDCVIVRPDGKQPSNNRK